MKRDKMRTPSCFQMKFYCRRVRGTVEAIERQISKLGFDCGVRAIYLAEKDKFNTANKVAMALLRQYNSLNLNG